jgi:hypothetical protein
MKLFKILLAGSLVANLALIAAVASKPSLVPSAVRDFFHLHDAKAEAAAAQRASQRAAAEARAATDRAVASRALLWSALASDDLPTLVAHLRAAGFSSAVIRAIVSSQIDQRFHARIKELLGTVADTPFWKSEPTMGFGTPKFFETYNQISRERAKMMRELLGDDLFAGTGDDPTAAQRRQYGNLSKAKIDLIQRIEEDYSEMRSQISSATQGIVLPEDRAKLALLEREKLVDLAVLLTPQELEDYQMRTSPITRRLRMPLSIMDATEADFLTIYRVQTPYADVLYPSVSAVAGISYSSSEQSQLRRDAQQKIADQLKQVLDPARYADYVRASTYEFQQLYRLVQQENLPTAAAVRTYDLRDTAAQESLRIFNDQALDPEQKRAALQTLAQNTSAQIVGLLGANAGNAYVKSASWLNYISQGRAVTFGADGRSTSYRSLPTPGK